jgi:hypothetical protein
MAVINLDTRRKTLKASTVIANGHKYTMPVYMPAMVMDAMFAVAGASADPAGARKGLRNAYVALFGEKQADQAMIDIEFEALENIAQEAYQVKPGESSASASS